MSPTFSAAGLTGPSSVTVSLRVCDGEPLCDTDTAIVYIEARQGERPVAADDSYSTLQDTPKIVGAPGVLGNDYAGECESLSAELVSGPSHGTVGGLAVDGSFTYTPDVGFVGTDTFTYKATCGELESNTATVTIHIGATPPLPAPPCTRADVSAIIHGGWDGIAVNASVGGTGQPTKHTATDSFGRAAVLWTFYPPAGATWTVTVTPQLPPGLDPERWTFEPASASASIRRCGEAQLTFQLIDRGEKEPEPAVILPVTGGGAAGAG